MRQTTLSVVAPVYCEGGHLHKFVASLTGVLTAIGLGWLIVSTGTSEG